MVRGGRAKKPSGAVGHLIAFPTSRFLEVPLREYASEKTEISAQEPTVVARFHSQAVLQRGVLA
jgi:hypothetical protein